MSGEDERHDEWHTDVAELQRVKACLAVAWGWMIAKGADDAALQAVGYLEIAGHPAINVDN